MTIAACFYVVIIVQLRRLRAVAATNSNVMEETNREFSLFVQFLVIFIVYFMYFESFWFTEQLSSIKFLPKIVLQMLTETLKILNSSVNPFLYMAFSSNMKEAMRRSHEAQNAADLAEHIQVRNVSSLEPLLRVRTSVDFNREIIESLDNRLQPPSNRMLQHSRSLTIL